MDDFLFSTRVISALQKKALSVTAQFEKVQ
jgi:hypothetical protein